VDLQAAVETLREGGLIGYPTETFYGIGADARSGAAVAKIFALKGRPPSEPIPLILPGAEWLSRVALGVPPAAERLARAFWPGPLTLIVRAASWIPPVVTAGGGTVGVRVSSHPVAAALARDFGAPLTSTSANRSGTPPLRSAREVLAAFPGLLVVDGGETPGGLPSTLIDLTADPPRLLRSGPVPWQEISRVINTL
jgi:L-threonylcarbamoyladenylate synthase